MAKILVVDDEPGYLRNLRLILEAAGHTVDTAETGEDALQAGRRACHDVLLADWKLKGSLGGLDVARTLSAGNPGLATIIMTGYSAAALLREATGVCNLHVLEKPFGADAVREIVRRAVEATAT